MDALDKLILEEREKLAALQAQVAALEAKLAGMLEAAALRPSSNGKKAAASGRGGKPKGAISSEWKATLETLYSTGRAWPYSEIKACFDHTNGKDLNIASVRDRVRSLVDTGLMQGDPETGFAVSDMAARKFKFPKIEKAPSADAREAFNNEGPVGRESGYPPSTPEGSTPSGSTPVHTSDFVADLDDDIPF